MEFEKIVAKLKNRWPEVYEITDQAGDPVVVIPAEKNLEILGYLKEHQDLYFNSLMSLAGADNGRELWVVYPLHSMKHLHRLLVKAILPHEDPQIQSVVPLWGMADFFEREAFDLYGIKFVGHPDLRRILNPPDWVGWPGRKDFEYPPEYQGIPTVRLHQFFAEVVKKEIDERDAKDKELTERLTAEVKKELADEMAAKKAADGASGA